VLVPGSAKPKKIDTQEKAISTKGRTTGIGGSPWVLYVVPWFVTEDVISCDPHRNCPAS
jgi:hypothetical protein